MLVLTRKAGEAIIIDGNIRIYFVEVGSRQVVVSIDAPREINIVREELLEEKKQ